MRECVVLDNHVSARSWGVRQASKKAWICGYGDASNRLLNEQTARNAFLQIEACEDFTIGGKNYLMERKQKGRPSSEQSIASFFRDAGKVAVTVNVRRIAETVKTAGDSFYQQWLSTNRLLAGVVKRINDIAEIAGFNREQPIPSYRVETLLSQFDFRTDFSL